MGTAGYSMNSEPAGEEEVEGVHVADALLLLRRAGFGEECSVRRIHGGGNNRVYEVRSSMGVPLLMKSYFRSDADPRDRFQHEHTFYELLQRAGILQTPRPLAWDCERRLGLFEFVPSGKLGADEVRADHVTECARFFEQINAARSLPAAGVIPEASEACFSLEQHVAVITARVQRLVALEAEAGADPRAVALVRERLLPAWRKVRSYLTANPHADEILPARMRCLSPSDFGFHNALVSPRGLLFFDFEYAGWDDPAKTVCDFFCQPEIPAPAETLPDFIEKTLLPGWERNAYSARVRALLPAYRIKWACIILNVFLRESARRRAFADSLLVSPEALEQQLSKANAQLEALCLG